jgi:hypothetical protein
MKTNRFFEMLLGRMDGNSSLVYFTGKGVKCTENEAKYYVLKGSVHNAETDKEIYTANLKTL